MSKIHTTEPLRPISGYRYERERRPTARDWLAAIILGLIVGALAGSGF